MVNNPNYLWRKVFLVFGIGFAALMIVLAVSFFTYLTRFEANSKAGFHWPYYLYISQGARQKASEGELITILAMPNNTNGTSDEFAAHNRFAVLNVVLGQVAFNQLDAAILVPVFPRPESHWQIYTHALDRDSLITDIPDLQRLDLQLVAMIDDAIQQLSDRNWNVDHDVLLWGFSASGMFVNRFTVLHPERVRAVAIQSPGGWPIAPVKTWQGACLRYPIGVCDLLELTGEEFDLQTYQSVPQFILMGTQDGNDSVPHNDGYEDEDEALIFEMFGTTPLERWDDAEKIYLSTGINAEFKLYPGVGHRPVGLRDVRKFFEETLQTEP
jgi:pimeloyl-ACP methyl ester carboxylesterase